MIFFNFLRNVLLSHFRLSAPVRRLALNVQEKPFVHTLRSH
jgi:hypothetical protein